VHRVDQVLVVVDRAVPEGFAVDELALEDEAREDRAEAEEAASTAEAEYEEYAQNW